MNTTLEDRIYGLSLLWKEAEYNFSYWEDLPDLNWDAAYQEFLPRVMAAEDPLIYYSELMKFVSLLKDGHTYVVMPEEIKPTYDVAIGTTYIEGKHVLGALPKDCPIPLYSEIISINGILTEDYLKKYAYPYIWHERIDSKFVHGLLGYIISCCESGVISIETDKGSFSFTKGENDETIQNDTIFFDRFSSMTEAIDTSTHSIHITDDNIAYIEIPTFSLSSLKNDLYANIDLIKNCKGFIIDVRYNSGGSSNNSMAVAQMFFQGEFYEGAADTPMHLASYKAYGQYKNMADLDLNDPWEKRIYDACTHKSFYYEKEAVRVSDCPVYLEQPVVVLASCSTASAAEAFLVQMKNQNRAVIVGTPSNGSNGQPYMGKLPGGGWYGICTHRCYLNDGTDYHNVGIKPDVYIENTIQDRINGVDRVFAKGLEVIRGLC